MTSLTRFISVALAVGAAWCCGPLAQAQSLSELAALARSYDAPWQAARAQLDAAGSRAEQARAGLLPSAGLSAGASYARTDVNRPSVELNAPTMRFRPGTPIARQRGIYQMVTRCSGASHRASSGVTPKAS